MVWWTDCYARSQDQWWICTTSPTSLCAAVLFLHERCWWALKAACIVYVSTYKFICFDICKFECGQSFKASLISEGFTICHSILFLQSKKPKKTATWMSRPFKMFDFQTKSSLNKNEYYFCEFKGLMKAGLKGHDWFRWLPRMSKSAGTQQIVPQWLNKQTANSTTTDFLTTSCAVTERPHALKKTHANVFYA